MFRSIVSLALLLFACLPLHPPCPLSHRPLIASSPRPRPNPRETVTADCRPIRGFFCLAGRVCACKVLYECLYVCGCVRVCVCVYVCVGECVCVGVCVQMRHVPWCLCNASRCVSDRPSPVGRRFSLEGESWGHPRAVISSH